MCVVSFVGDYRRETPVQPWNPWALPPNENPWKQYPEIWPDIVKRLPTVPAEEAEQDDVKRILDADMDAIKYDEENDEPDCHDPDKFAEFDALEERCLEMMLDEASGDADKEIIAELVDMVQRIQKLRSILS